MQCMCVRLHVVCRCICLHHMRSWFVQRERRCHRMLVLPPWQLVVLEREDLPAVRRWDEQRQDRQRLSSRLPQLRAWQLVSQECEQLHSVRTRPLVQLRRCIVYGVPRWQCGRFCWQRSVHAVPSQHVSEQCGRDQHVAVSSMPERRAAVSSGQQLPAAVHSRFLRRRAVHATGPARLFDAVSLRLLLSDGSAVRVFSRHLQRAAGQLD